MATRPQRTDPTRDPEEEDEDGTGRVDYDLDDMEDSGGELEAGSSRISVQPDVSYDARRDSTNEIEFHGPWVKAVGENGDTFYLEKSRNNSHRESSKQRLPSSNRKSELRRPNSKGANSRDAFDSDSVSNGFNQRVKKTVTFEDTGFITTFILPSNSNGSNYARYATKCEELFGIVPEPFPTTDATGSDMKFHNRVLVKGLIPRGAALKAGVKIGDWLMAVDDIDINAKNIDEILSLISSDRKVKLTLQRISMTPLQRPKKINGTSGGADELVSLVSGERQHEISASLHDVVHGALYLRTDVQSDNIMDKEDVVYHYPRQEGNHLLERRGGFVALGQLVKDVTDNLAKNSSAVIHSQLVHVSYLHLDHRMFLLCLPAARFSASQLNYVMQDVLRILLVLYNSLESAFELEGNHSKLDQFFALVFDRLLLAHEHQSSNPYRQEFLEPFTSSLCGIRAVLLPEQVKVLVHNCLSEFEAADFADMAESYSNVRRSYTILGSSLYYKGYLLANHLRKEDATDIDLYLRYHGLLTLSDEQQLGHLVVWKEVFPTDRFHKVSTSTNPGYLEPEARWFLLAVGMQNAILAVLLEAGGCAEKARGHPTPDPFYIDQANATLTLLSTLDVFGLCDLRLEGPPMPSLSSVDWFITSKGGKNWLSRSSAGTPFARPPKMKKVKPKSILMPKNPFGASLTQLHIQERYFWKQSTDKYSSESDLHGEANYDDYLSSDSNDDSYESQDRGTVRTFANSNESLATGAGSRLFKASKQSHNLLRLYDVSDVLRNAEEVELAAAGSRVKLVAGFQDTLFHYVMFDNLEGIFVCPSQQEMRQVTSATHSAVLRNFNLACLDIHRIFEKSSAKAKGNHSADRKDASTVIDSSLNKTKEYGVLFNCPLSYWTDIKKPPPSTAYWVVGRLLESPMPSEFYVCFHDSAPQNIVEMAFKLVQGTLV